MAEVQSVIVLTTGDTIESEMSVERVRQQLAATPGRPIAFVEFPDADGHDHLVNVHQIVEIREPAEPGSATIVTDE